MSAHEAGFDGLSPDAISAEQTAGGLPRDASATGPSPLETTLREVVDTLAPIDRTPCSPGERHAAEWVAQRLRAVAGVDVALEDEPSWGIFPPTSAALGVLGMLGASFALRGQRLAGATLALASVAGIVDEAQNGPRVVRRLFRTRRTTVNLVARAGATDAPNTLVVLAHHDAPQTGMLFDQGLQKRVHELAPQVLAGVKTPPPQWWVGLAGPLATVWSALRNRRGAARAGLAIGAVGTALIADIWRSNTVPGANDNLSAVASLVALAELLADDPIPDLRVLLVSCGAEETLQDGIRAFMARHQSELEPARTWFVNLDTVGSPHLVMLEAEGPIWMETHAGPQLRDLLAERAQALEIPLERGFRARASTDSIIPSRARYPIATLVSITDWRSPANYHLPSDVPENLVYGTIADATRLVYDVGVSLARGALGR